MPEGSHRSRDNQFESTEPTQWAHGGETVGVGSWSPTRAEDKIRQPRLSLVLLENQQTTTRYRRSHRSSALGIHTMVPTQRASQKYKSAMQLFLPHQERPDSTAFQPKYFEVSILACRAVYLRDKDMAIYCGGVRSCGNMSRPAAYTRGKYQKRISYQYSLRAIYLNSAERRNSFYSTGRRSY